MTLEESIDWAGASRALAEWYRENGRHLPWRLTADPYAVWVSETMLQQTQVSRVVPLYLAWLSAFPNCRSLAEADESAVLSLWRGLGYYSRARNMLASARLIVSAGYDGPPNDQAFLAGLPGFGPYTAAAVRALAYDEPTAALDGNLRRVSSRLTDLDKDPALSEGNKVCQRAVESLMKFQSPRLLTNALMDLGSGPCAPRPRCLLCPLEPYCLARKRGTTALRPVRRAARPIRRRLGAALLFSTQTKLAVRQRPKGGLWSEFWEIPWEVGSDGEDSGVTARRLAASLGEESFPEPLTLSVTMRFTSWQVETKLFRAASQPTGTELLPVDDALSLPMPLGILRLLREALQSGLIR